MYFDFPFRNGVPRIRASVLDAFNVSVSGTGECKLLNIRKGLISVMGSRGATGRSNSTVELLRRNLEVVSSNSARFMAMSCVRRQNR